MRKEVTIAVGVIAVIAAFVYVSVRNFPRLSVTPTPVLAAEAAQASLSSKVFRVVGTPVPVPTYAPTQPVPVTAEPVEGLQTVPITITEEPGALSPTAIYATVVAPRPTAAPVGSAATVAPAAAEGAGPAATAATAVIEATLAASATSAAPATAVPQPTAMPASTRVPTATALPAVALPATATAESGELAAAPTPAPAAPATAAAATVETTQASPAATAETAAAPTEAATAAAAPASTSEAETAVAAEPTPTPVASYASEPAVESAAGQRIGGLTLADLRTRLKTMFNLACGSSTEVGGLLQWTCTGRLAGGGLLSVVIAGTDANHIISITASVSGSGRTAQKVLPTFFSYLAGLPYQDSQPAQAQTWARGHLAGGATTIGGVSFRLYTQAGIRTLEIYTPAVARGKG